MKVRKSREKVGSTDENFPRAPTFSGVRRNRSWRKRSRNRWRNRFPFIRLCVCTYVYQLERISVENSRDREQINRLVILTRPWPARSREAHPRLSLSLFLSRSFVRSSLRTFEFYSPLLAGGKFCSGFGGELTRNNASPASRMLC